MKYVLIILLYKILQFLFKTKTLNNTKHGKFNIKKEKTIKLKKSKNVNNIGMYLLFNF